MLKQNEQCTKLKTDSEGKCLFNLAQLGTEPAIGKIMDSSK